MAVFDIDDAVRCRMRFYDETGTTLVDPGTVKFDYHWSGDAVTTLTYGVSSRVVRESTGVYYVDIDAATEGVWFVRFYAPNTSTYQCAQAGNFQVQNAGQF